MHFFTRVLTAKMPILFHTKDLGAHTQGEKTCEMIHSIQPRVQDDKFCFTRTQHLCHRLLDRWQHFPLLKTKGHANTHVTAVTKTISYTHTCVFQSSTDRFVSHCEKPSHAHIVLFFGLQWNDTYFKQFYLSLNYRNKENKTFNTKLMADLLFFWKPFLKKGGGKSDKNNVLVFFQQGSKIKTFATKRQFLCLDVCVPLMLAVTATFIHRPVVISCHCAFSLYRIISGKKLQSKNVSGECFDDNFGFLTLWRQCRDVSQVISWDRCETGSAVAYSDKGFRGERRLKRKPQSEKLH